MIATQERESRSPIDEQCRMKFYLSRSSGPAKTYSLEGVLVCTKDSARTDCFLVYLFLRRLVFLFDRLRHSNTNLDGTFTQLDDDYYVPATGWSYLDLYLMGLLAPAEVPDFFILRNLVPSGRDKDDRAVFKADRSRVTIQDVIAAEGPRLPDVEPSQKQFNTGIVVIVEQGARPSRELIDRANGIRERWIDYWATTTGHRSSMTANPK